MIYALFDKTRQDLVGFIDNAASLSEGYLIKEISTEYQDLTKWKWSGDYSSGKMEPLITTQRNNNNNNANVAPIILEELKIKDPALKLCYAAGLGDLVAWFLHNPPFGWLVRLITGKVNPCKKCNLRIQALNILLPIPIWRLFFKDKAESKATLFNDYIQINKKLTQNYANR